MPSVRAVLTDLLGFVHRVGARRGVVCLAPHPDDESAGCGGFLAGCGRLGIPVRVVVLTDGAASHRSETWPPGRLAALRREELSAALRRLGLGRAPLHLGLRDAALAEGVEEDRAVRRLAAILRRERPGVLLVTWRREPHGDHRRAARIARAAAQGLGIVVAEYMVWTPLTGGTGDRPRPPSEPVVDLVLASADRRAKRAALACHRSQLGEVVRDDPDGFVLSAAQVDAMTGKSERYVVGG